MKLLKCINGHYYDSTKEKACPYCQEQVKEEVKPEVIEVKPVEEIVINKEMEAVLEDKSPEFDPVTGWLVCIEGADKGKDYKIRSEKNFIGRSPRMDVCISGDAAVSKENHAIVSFNPKKRIFKVHPGEGRGLVYLNGDDIDAAKEIKSYDIIELGNTKLLFIALCGESFGWEQT